jgi:uroporphyrinogen-III synthase
VEQGGGGDAPALAAHIAARLSPANGALLHAAGNVVRGDFQTMLEAQDFQVRRVVLYRAEPIARLDEGAAQAIGAGGLDGVLLHSPRSAREFVRLVAQARLSRACADLTAYCLSHAVAKAGATVTWRAVHVAARPDQEALLALLAAAPAATPPAGR